ncbi:IS3 family transposase [Ectobacillus funiculus]|uniref:IS3 family transposase n=1 Tax=Ectobacillus funiculus TaxID=137993 RepID=UPI00397B3D83
MKKDIGIQNFFGHLKSKLLYLQSFQTKEMVRRAVRNYIYFYNTERIQLKLHSHSPIEYRRMAAS